MKKHKKLLTESLVEKETEKKSSFVLNSYFSHEYALREIKIDFMNDALCLNMYQHLINDPVNFFVVLYFFLYFLPSFVVEKF